ncbi:hypothetical protein HYH03_007073 [Edaphochlamys debaryana]|uniref:Uncharacterized protein n=1 Tax=Edaphochlamys debaryana TaxID=47281 RepID=A0A836C0S9_9CHLO|nr:hypothetical protein HYH03_007073 [Edaphochlamys debaryana]|eukprot:KAG2494833.1 hypothetical protein HYH03_007073 [Edaphochlamys debaryana]
MLAVRGLKRQAEVHRAGGGRERAAQADAQAAQAQQEEFDDPQHAEEVWGEMVLAAYDAAYPEEEEEQGEAEEGDLEEPPSGFSLRPTMGCMDRNKWADAIDMLADRILRDRDFEQCEEFDFGANTALMRAARVEPGYFEPFKGPGDRKAEERLYEFLLPFTR